jgi:hypothetical protein
MSTVESVMRNVLDGTADLVSNAFLSWSQTLLFAIPAALI